jgi:phage-related tail protein
MYEKYLNKLESLLDTKLEKTEKVEFADYDFKKYKQQYDKSFTKYRNDYRKNINGAKSATDKHFVEVFDLLEKAEKEFDEFGNKAKELGVDFRGTKQFQEFQQLKKILLSRSSDIKQRQKEISKIL